MFLPESGFFVLFVCVSVHVEKPQKKQKKKCTSLPLCAAGAEQPAEFVAFYMVLSESISSSILVGTLTEPDLTQLNLT